MPIDGVGLQAHQFSGHPPEPGVSRGSWRGSPISAWRSPSPSSIYLSHEGGDPDAQADGYRQIVRECLEAGCTEITVWGVYDGATWLDDFLGREDTSPLLFDHDFEPKPAHSAVIEELAAAASTPPPPADR